MYIDTWGFCWSWYNAFYVSSYAWNWLSHIDLLRPKIQPMGRKKLRNINVNKTLNLTPFNTLDFQESFAFWPLSWELIWKRISIDTMINTKLTNEDLFKASFVSIIVVKRQQQKPCFPMFKMVLKESLCYATNQIQRRVWSYPVIIKENGFAFVPFTLKITRYSMHWRAPINICKISIKLSPSFKFFMVKSYFLLQKSKFGINKNCYDTNLGPWV